MSESTLKALQASERALLELVPSHRSEGCWCAFGYNNRVAHSHRCRRAAEALAAVQAELEHGKNEHEERKETYGTEQQD